MKTLTLSRNGENSAKYLNNILDFCKSGDFNMRSYRIKETKDGENIIYSIRTVSPTKGWLQIDFTIKDLFHGKEFDFRQEKHIAENPTQTVTVSKGETIQVDRKKVRVNWARIFGTPERVQKCSELLGYVEPIAIADIAGVEEVNFDL
jgi:hypothetical protein